MLAMKRNKKAPKEVEFLLIVHQELKKIRVSIRIINLARVFIIYFFNFVFYYKKNFMKFLSGMILLQNRLFPNGYPKAK